MGTQVSMASARPRESKNIVGLVRYEWVTKFQWPLRGLGNQRLYWQFTQEHAKVVSMASARPRESKISRTRNITQPPWFQWPLRGLGNQSLNLEIGQEQFSVSMASARPRESKCLAVLSLYAVRNGQFQWPLRGLGNQREELACLATSTIAGFNGLCAA